MQVNRYLKNKRMDHIDHALGRPVDPLAETYRNRFAIEPDAPETPHFQESDHWEFWGTIPGGLLCFRVTQAGREALRDHLKEIGDKNRLWAVYWGGFRVEKVAETRGKARYRAWLDASDAYSDLTFKDFQAASTVKLA